MKIKTAKEISKNGHHHTNEYKKIFIENCIHHNTETNRKRNLIKNIYSCNDNT